MKRGRNRPGGQIPNPRISEEEAVQKKDWYRGYVVVGGNEVSLTFFNPQTGHTKRINDKELGLEKYQSGRIQWITKICHSTLGRSDQFLYSTTFKRVYKFDINEEKNVEVFQGKQMCRSVVGLKENLFATLELDKTCHIRLWKEKENKCVLDLDDQGFVRNYKKLSPRPGLLIPSELGGSLFSLTSHIGLWDIERSTRVMKFEVGQCFGMEHGRSILFTCHGSEKCVKFWDIRTPPKKVGIIRENRGVCEALLHDHSSEQNLLVLGGYSDLSVHDLRKDKGGVFRAPDPLKMVSRRLKNFKSEFGSGCTNLMKLDGESKFIATSRYGRIIVYKLDGKRGAEKRRTYNDVYKESLFGILQLVPRRKELDWKTWKDDCQERTAFIRETMNDVKTNKGLKNHLTKISIFGSLESFYFEKLFFLL